MKISKKTDLGTNRGGEFAISHPGYAGVQVLALTQTPSPWFSSRFGGCSIEFISFIDDLIISDNYETPEVNIMLPGANPSQGQGSV